MSLENKTWNSKLNGLFVGVECKCNDNDDNKKKKKHKNPVQE